MEINKSKKILVTGSSGYVGGRLVSKLIKKGYSVRVLVRNPERIKDKFWYNEVDVFKGNVLDAHSLVGALSGIDVAYYLIHSMEADKDFVKSDMIGASNFAKSANEEKIEKIIYFSIHC